MSFLKKLLVTAAASIAAASCFALDASAANGSGAYGASIPSYGSSFEIDVVKDCKADPSGGSDSYSAIQKALSQASKKSSGTKCGIVKVPSGTYNISQSLHIGSNTQLILDDDATIVRCFDSGCMIYNDASGAGGYDGASNILIQGGRWDGNTDNYGSAYTFSNLRLAHANNVVLRNMKVLNNKNGHHMEIGGVSGLTIEGCYFSGYTGALLKEAIQLDVMNCDELFTGFPPFDDTACNNVIIRNNTFADIPRGIGSHSAVPGVYYTNITIENNTFTGISNICMVLYNYKHCTISGNTITDSAAGITFNYMSDESFRHFFPPVNGFQWALDNMNSDADTVISNNTITTQQMWLQNYPYGIKIYGSYVNGTNNYPGADYAVSNVEIRNNTLTCADAAVLLTDVYNSRVSGNAISSNGSVTNVESYLISGNYCYSCEISGNTVSGALKSGINLSNVQDSTLSGNTISNCQSLGILSDNCSNTKISGNSFTDNTTGGIKVGSGCEKITCSENVIKNCGEYGIKVAECGTGKDIKIKSNDITGVASGITCVKNGRAYLSGNSFEAVTDKVYADAADLVTLLKPRNFTAEEITSDRIKLTWQSISEADGIHIYRRQAGSADFVNIASVESGSIFQDESLVQGTNYYYMMIPYIEYGEETSETKPSSEIAARTKINLQTAVIDCVAETGFTSRPVMPRFTVTADGTKLTAGIDYNYTYSNNIFAGTAKITVTGRGNCIGSCEQTFEIKLGAPQGLGGVQLRPSPLGSIEKRTYMVRAVRQPSSLYALSDTRILAPVRVIDSITIGLPYRMTSESALWTGSGYSYF